MQLLRDIPFRTQIASQRHNYAQGSAFGDVVSITETIPTLLNNPRLKMAAPSTAKGVQTTRSKEINYKTPSGQKGGGTSQNTSPSSKTNNPHLIMDPPGQRASSPLQASSQQKHQPKAMNIVVPMGGVGSRFANHGYRLPKPLISIAGRPMIIWILSNLKFVPGDTLFLAVRPELETRFALSSRIRAAFPGLHVVTVVLDFDTRGAAETLYIVTQQMTDVQLARKTISLDCDTIYFSDALTPFRALPADSGCSLYFEDDQPDPIFSYITLDGEDASADVKDPRPSSPTAIITPLETKHISGIAEKVRISSHANTGGYGFGSAHLMQKYLVETLENGIPSVGEYYTSSVIARMLSDGHVFHGIYIEDFSCVGTVPQLQDFLHALRTTRPYLSPPQTFCFDLYGTLIQKPDMTQREEANVQNVNLVQSLIQCGHIVKILSTTADEKTGGVVKGLGISGAIICGGKPEADYYMATTAGIEEDSIERRVGWSSEQSSSKCQPIKAYS